MHLLRQTGAGTPSASDLRRPGLLRQPGGSGGAGGGGAAQQGTGSLAGEDQPVFPELLRDPVEPGRKLSDHASRRPALRGELPGDREAGAEQPVDRAR